MRSVSRGFVPGNLHYHHHAALVYKPSDLVNAALYRAARSPDVNADETLNWTSQMISLVKNRTMSVDIGSTLQTAIRRGVPDALKHALFFSAQDAHAFKAKYPKYYNDQLHHTFGAKIPNEFHHRVPTFSGGFLGIEEEILGTPLDVEQLEVEHRFTIRRSEISWTDLHLLSTNEASGDNSQRSHDDDSWGSETDIDAYDAHTDDASLKYRSYLKYPQAGTPSQPASPNVLPHYRNGRQLRPPGLQAGTPREEHSSTSWRSSLLNPLVPHAHRGASETSSPTSGQSPLPGAGSPAPSLPSAAGEPSPRAVGSGSLRQNELRSRSSRRRRFLRYCRRTFCCSRGDTAMTGSITDLRDEALLPNPISQCMQRLETLPPEPNSSVLLRDEGVRDVYRVESITHLHHYLSEHGLTAVKRLLWCVNATFPDIEFCPLLPNLLCICLLYLTEADTFVLVTCLVKAARRAAGDHDEMLFMPYRRTEYVRFVKFVVAVASKCVPKLMQHLASLQVDVAAWMAKIMADGLVRTVSFDALLRIYGSFLFEGVKVIQRYCLAILKINEHRLLRCTSKTEAIDTLYSTKDHVRPSQINSLTKIAFRISVKWNKGGITKYTSYDLPTPFLTGVKVQRFYRPRLRESSAIIPDADWQYIWGWLPHGCRILDLFLSWRSDRDGMSLLALEKKLHSVQNQPMVFLLRTQQSEVIGGFCEATFTSKKKLLHNLDRSTTCVFQVRPTPNAYWWSGANQMFIELTPDFIVVGGDSVAIYIDRDVHRGRCRPSASFDCPQLAGNDLGDFLISSMEVWTLH